jgi:hypothetical protein
MASKLIKFFAFVPFVFVSTNVFALQPGCKVMTRCENKTETLQDEHLKHRVCHRIQFCRDHSNDVDDWRCGGWLNGAC